MKFDKVFLVISLVLGLLLGVLLEPLYDLLVPVIGTRIPLVVIYMSIYMVVLGVVLLIKGLVNGTYVNKGKVTLLIVNFAVGKSQQYVFLLDDSGSMYSNDRNNIRYSAAETIIRNLKPTNMFSVYRFGDKSFCEVEMGTKDSQSYTFSVTPGADVGGGTALMTSVKAAINDLPIKRKGHTRIIILTDGDPGDTSKVSINDIANSCEDNNVSVSSVGFGNANGDFLTELAEKTNGIYVFSNDINSLTNQLEAVVNSKLPSKRDIIGHRFDSKANSFLYGFLRVLFLILLGAIHSVIKMLLVGEKRFTKFAFVMSIVLCAIASVFVELLCMFGIAGYIVRCLMCIMWACTLIPINNYEKIDLGNQLHSEYESGIKSGVASDLTSGRQGGGGPNSFL